MSTRISKFLSLVLRHEPARIGITLDSAGWTDVDALIAACAAHGVAFDRRALESLVATSDKQRFALSADGTRIRCNQGHSVAVDLALSPATPPDVLYHGTVDRFLSSIRTRGLVKGERHAVHLAADHATAYKVGARRGAPVVLSVRAAAMAAAGHTFFVSANGVWLTDHVPPEFLDEPVAQSRDRDARVAVAQATVEACEAGFYSRADGARVEVGTAIAEAKAGTRLYELAHEAWAAPGAIDPAARPAAATEISVISASTIEAVLRLAPTAGHLACLNFASARNPGGGFLTGAHAQEEALARATALYPCQLTQMSHYERNLAERSPLYLDLALWSPHVPVLRDDDCRWLDVPVPVSIVTCAAPNAGAFRGASTASEADTEAQIEAALERRARLVLAVARHHQVETLVLGAWGAGVFSNDPTVVARIFRAHLAGAFAGAFARVVFAVPGSLQTSANLRAFSDAFA